MFHSVRVNKYDLVHILVRKDWSRPDAHLGLARTKYVRSFVDVSTFKFKIFHSSSAKLVFVTFISKKHVDGFLIHISSKSVSRYSWWRIHFGDWCGEWWFAFTCLMRLHNNSGINRIHFTNRFCFCDTISFSHTKCESLLFPVLRYILQVQQVTRFTFHLMRTAVNQSINQSICWLISRSVHIWVIQSINQSTAAWVNLTNFFSFTGVGGRYQAFQSVDFRRW